MDRQPGVFSMCSVTCFKFWYKLTSIKLPTLALSPSDFTEDLCVLKHVVLRTLQQEALQDTRLTQSEMFIVNEPLTSSRTFGLNMIY
jgi:hypothetical protein